MISKEDIEHLEDLARVKFDEGAAGKLANDLGNVLSYVETLKEVDVANAQEMTHAMEVVKNIFRKDGPSFAKASEGKAADLEKKSQLARELIDAFPDRHDTGHGIYLKVKSIL